MSIDASLPPPLLVAPLATLSVADRAEFHKDVADISSAVEGMVVSVAFPIALYHRIDGIWIPVSDLGAFQGPHPRSEPVAEESSYVSNESVACENADTD